MLESTHPLAELLTRDDRYHFDAYVFVFDALRYGQEKLHLGRDTPQEEISGEPDFDDEEGPERHVTGQELCEAIRLFALDQYGMLAKCVLETWGVRSTGDFGEIVFNLIDIGQMRKTENDTREDFENVYDFSDALLTTSVFQQSRSSEESST